MRGRLDYRSVSKNQGKSSLRQRAVVSVHPLHKPLCVGALHCLLPCSKLRMSTFQINIEIPDASVNRFFKMWQLLLSPRRRLLKEDEDAAPARSNK